MKSLIFGIIFFLIATFPATWLLMLFLGNLHLGLSYWGTLPLGILVSALLGSATTGYSRRDFGCRPHTCLGGLAPNEFAARSQQDHNPNGFWL